MDTEIMLSDRVKAILREADAAIFRLVGESHHLLYQFLRLTASRIARVDAFYIGFFCERSMMVYPYSYDGKEYYDPNKFKYNPQGLSAWILENKKPYQFKQDDGDLLHTGKSFGQLHKKSEDVVSVPILTSNRKKELKVIGIMSMQTYEPDTYNEEAVYALEWLAKSLVLVLEREKEDESRRKKLVTEEQKISEPMLQPDNIVNQMLDKMQSIRRKADELKRFAADGEPLAAVINELIDECHKRQTETIELFLRSALTKDSPISTLSKKELEIVALLIEGRTKSKSGYTNAEIAEKIVISENTVKSHIKAICKKLGVSGREGIVLIAQDYQSELPKVNK